MKTARLLRLAAAATAVLAAAPPARAGGPLAVFSPGQPYLWVNGGVGIPFHPDLGGLGPQSNAQAVAQTAAAFGAWAAVPSARATYTNAGALAVDVDETNFGPYLNPTAPDGLSAIVYDEDGAIFELLFGADSGVLGFAGPEWLDTVDGTIVEGVAFMNGGSLLGEDAFPVDEMTSVQVHEFGHYSNLAHTVVNGQVALGDTTGPTPDDTFPPPATLAGRVETMYPFLFVNGGQATPHPDDVAMLSHLYPEPTFAATTAAISGRILGPNGVTPITGVNVIARNVANPYDDAVSAISSDFTTDYSPDAPLVGTYTLRGLTPGASYAVFVDQILEGGFSTPPRIPLPGVEEFYNAGGESADAGTDDPGEFAAVAAAAGGTAGGVDVVFNRVTPGPLALGDDGSVELFPSFTFEFCGQEYTSLFVNANGNVTLGAVSGGFSETIQGHLGGPPRIAALWDDLDPAAGGTVAYEETPSELTVTWTDVPEYGTTNANSFSITLRAASRRSGHHGHRHGDDDDGCRGGSAFSVRYGALAAADGLAGYSCGGRVTSGFELETDLRRSAGARRRTIEGAAAVFEMFTAAAGDNDLDGFELESEGVGRFDDDLEPNDRFSRAVRVRLPYNNADRFAEIGPLGGDVDFYRFTASAGEILVVETVPGNQVDTLIGLFDAAGALLTLDDDQGAFGAGGLSRFAVEVPADGTYYVGVTTWPDFGFTGAGQDSGRYVLTIQSYRGTLLDLADDDSVAVPLGFNFPFQGALHTEVFVNANGNLTFGAGDGDFGESVGELLSGRPRIAPFWDDLFPFDGLVIAEHTPRSLSIHFATVPEFFSLRPNYFSVTLERDGDVEMEWLAMTRTDAIIGVTPGGGAANPGPTDLSRRREWPADGTTYEQFLGFFSEFDLSFRGIDFEAWQDDDDR